MVLLSDSCDVSNVTPSLCCSSSGTPIFIFEMFDEPWKGGDDPAEVEKHWGLFGLDREAKPAGRLLDPR